MKYKVGTFEIDTERFCVTCSGEDVAVEPKVFDLLVYLIQHRDHVITRDELFAQIWAGREVTDTTLSNHIKSIRKIFGDSGELQSVVKTIRGRGYQFIADVSELPSARTPPLPPRHSSLSQTLPNRQLTQPRGLWLAGLMLLSAFIWFLLEIEPKIFSQTDERPHVLVLPFGVSSSEDEKWQPFADQISREVIRKLSRVKALQVVPQASAFQFQSDKTLAFVRNKMPEVDYVLDATVNISGGVNMRISADMIDLSSGTTMWAQSFQSPTNDQNLFAIQSKIAHSVSDSLELVLGEHEHSALYTFPTSNLSAYERYIEGQHHLNQLQLASLKKAIALFDQAINLDPDFDAAYVAKANAYRLIMSYFANPSEVLPEVVNAVQDALSINPNSAEAFSALGLAYALAWRWQDAWNMLNAAKQNDPRMSQTELGFALYYAGIGDNAKVIQSLDKAKKLDPLNVEVADWGHWSLAMVGEVDAAVNWSQQQLQIHPNIGMLFSGASLSASLKGEHERAISLAETGIKLDSKTPYAYLALAQAYGHAGQNHLIAPLLDKAIQMEQYACPYETAVTYILLDDFEKAFEYLDDAVNARSNCLVFTRNDIRLTPIRSDPRYQALLIRVGLDDESLSKYPR